MKKVYLLLDRSGSMDTQWKESINAINAYVNNLRGDVGVVFSIFDNQGYDIIYSGHIDGWKNLTPDFASPRGMTPLIDASVRMLNLMIEDKAEKAVFVSITDGLENTSNEFTKVDLQTKMDKIKTMGYEYVFLGASFDKIGQSVSDSYGIHDSSKFINTSARTRAVVMENTAKMTNEWLSGESATMGYSETAKAEAAVE